MDDQDFVLDEPGDVHEAPERQEHFEQVIPDEASVGAEDWEDEQEGLIAGFARRLSDVLTPKPYTTPEHEFVADEAVNQLADALKFLAGGVRSKEARHFRFFRQTVTDTPTRIVGWQPHRHRVEIANPAGNDNVYLGDSASVTSATGFQLTTAAANDTSRLLDLHGEDEIWAVCASGETAVLHIIAEYYAVE